VVASFVRAGLRFVFVSVETSVQSALDDFDKNV